MMTSNNEIDIRFVDKEAGLNKTNHNSVTLSQVGILKNQVILNPSISLVNYIFFNLYYLLIIFAYVSIDTLQPTLLTDPNYYNVSQEDLTSVNSTILVWDMGIKIIMAPFYGAFCDKIGRRPVVFIGIISMSIGLALLPVIGGSGSVFPLFVVARGIYANGAIACIVVPFLADYVDYETKGRAAGILVVLAGLGAVFSSSYSLSLTQNFTIGQRFQYLAIIVFVAGMIVALGLKGGKYHKNLYHDVKAEQAKRDLLENNELDSDEGSPVNTEESTAEEQKGVFHNISRGIKQARNPWIFIGYIVSFLSRGDTGILSFSLVIWSKHYYANTASEQNNAEIQAYILSGIAYSVLFLVALFFGFFGDKYSKFKSLLVVFVSTIIGLIMLVLSSGPHDALAFASMAFIGVGIAGYETFSLQLVNKYANARYRGSVNAMSSLLGVVGLVAVSIGGGYLMGVNINASFYIFMGFSVLALLITIHLYIKSEVVRKL